MSDIAVIGIGLRFPGKARSPSDLWDVLEGGEIQWSEIPKDRMNVDGYYHPSGDRQGTISFRGAHFIDGDITAFDTHFFSVAAEDAKAIDPQQRMLLEVSYEALENAGIRKEDIDDTDASVYVGSFVKDYEQICLKDQDWQPQYAATGNGIAIMANRISYFYNLHGPSMTIDTGCSGSLVSIDLAAQSLRSGQSSLAIAAGAGMILTPNTIMPMTALNFLSPDGKCFTFDARANGYGRGEGIGVVILKRLEDAIRDNDNIRAVIRGTRVNQDGHTKGITLPSKEAQVANIHAVYKEAGLDFDQTAYVECHGTGTQAGDWRELKAVSETLASVRHADNPIVVGSLKPNIGHLEGSAGIAGLIKGVLMLEQGKIPPNINFESGNPDIDFAAWKVKVPTQCLPWPIPGRRRVGVNCFGFGGTNAHVIMDQAPSPPASLQISGRPSEGACDEPRLYCYSSHEKTGVSRILSSHLPYIEKHEDESGFIEDYAFTLGCRRSEFVWRGTMIASSTAELISKIRDIDSVESIRSKQSSKTSICFTFAGQGSQWARMGQGLMIYGPFRDAMQQASLYLQLYFCSNFDLLEEILKPSDQSRLSDPEISQPAVTAFQVALVDLLHSFGIRASRVVGHSSGEIAAAYAAGAITREQAWEIAYFRGLAALKTSAKAPKLVGAMLAVGMSYSEMEQYLHETDVPLQIACDNSPRSVTMSGNAVAIHALELDLKSRGVFCRLLDVKIAYHSSTMRLVEMDYRDALCELRPRDSPTGVQIYSSVTGKQINGSELDGTYWSTNLTSTVRYVDAITALMTSASKELPTVMIELSPRATLRTPITDIISTLSLKTQPSFMSATDRHSTEKHSILKMVGDLWCRGCEIDMRRLSASYSPESSFKCLTDLPSYPWNHERTYWHESHMSTATRFRKFGRQDLIGSPCHDSVSLEPRWRGFLRVSENPWIQDHQVQRTLVYPAAGLITMVLEGASQLTEDIDNVSAYEVVDMHFEKAMLVPTTAHGLEVLLSMKLADGGILDNTGSNHEFSIFAKDLDKPWTKRASGSLRIHTSSRTSSEIHKRLDAVRAQIDTDRVERLIPRQLYEELDVVGMNYGNLFQNVTELRKGRDCYWAKVRVPDTKAKMPAEYEYPHIIHPATLDAMFHTLFAIETTPMVPTFLKSLLISADVRGRGGEEFEGCADARRVGARDAQGNIHMRLNTPSASIVAIQGLHLSALSTIPPEDGGFLPNHRHLCTTTTWDKDITTARPRDLADLLQLMSFKYPAMRIMQIGIDLSLTNHMLHLLKGGPEKTARLTRFTILDDIALLHSEQRHEGSEGLDHLVEYRSLSEIDSLAQYNLVVALNDNVNVESLRCHLLAGGMVAAACRTTNGFHAEYTSLTNGHGLLESPVMTSSGEKSVFPSQIGFDRATAMDIHQWNDVSTLRRTSLKFLTPRDLHSDAVPFIDSLSGKLHDQFGDISSSLLCLDEIPQMKASDLSESIIVSLLDFTQSSSGSSVYEWGPDAFDSFKYLQQHCHNIFWITRAAHMTTSNPKGSPIFALARTLMSEDPLKTFATIDIAKDSHLCHDSVARAAFAAFIQIFASSAEQGSRDLAFSEFNGELYIPRFDTIDSLNLSIEDRRPMSESTERSSWHLEWQEIIKDSSIRQIVSMAPCQRVARSFIPTEPTEFCDHKVVVRLSSAALTHLDLDVVTGHSTDSSLCLDVVGKVMRRPEGNTDLAFMQTVAGLVPGMTLQDRYYLDPRFVRPYSNGPLPSHVLGAYYGLVHVGRLSAGRTVLVHAGASAYGYAAICVAKVLGARVLVTIFGQSIEQGKSVLDLGIPKEHILDADNGDFVKDVLSLTKGKGVDVVFNPTTANLEANLRCVRRCGSIFQFANKSPTPKPSRMHNASVSVLNYDLRSLYEEDKDFVADLLSHAWRFAENHAVFNPHTREFDCAEINEAIKHIAMDPYLGFATVNDYSEPPFFQPTAALSASQTFEMRLRSRLPADRTYVLAGGLGGLGRSIAELLVANGVKNLAFVSRTGASSSAATAFLENLARRGIRAEVYCVDLCDEEGLAQAAARMTTEMPPVGGVFQCAAVIRDAMFENMTYGDWEAAIRPKTVGSWNLLQSWSTIGREEQGNPHDPFFIFLSSSAGVIGNRGQANYAAGNGFQDALAQYCRFSGRSAVSVDLGPVLGAGMLTEDEEVLSMLRASGFYGIRHQDFLNVISHAIAGKAADGTEIPSQITLGIGTGGLMRQNAPADPYWTRTAQYTYLNLIDMAPDLSVSPRPGSNEGGQLNGDPRTVLSRCSDAETATKVVLAGLTRMLAKALNLLPEELDTSRPPSAYGVDSLVAAGVRNWIHSSLGVQVSVFEVLGDKTIAELSATIAERGGFGAEGKE